MPFKHNAARRHRIPKGRHRIRNCRGYEAGLTRRGDLMPWLDEAAMAGWQTPRRTTPGSRAWYSDAAVEPVLVLRLVFHPALHRAEGLAASVLRVLGQDLRILDDTILSRRSRDFAGRRPNTVPHGPMHLEVNSTGVKPFGQGEWDGEEHGRARRSWRKLHIAVDADTAEIVACVLTDNGADDAAQMPVLLEWIEGEIATVTADGAYDGDQVYRAVAGHQPDAVIPPRSSRAHRLCRTRAPLPRRASATATCSSSRRRAAWLASVRPATAGAASRRLLRWAATRRSSVGDCAPALYPSSRTRPAGQSRRRGRGAQPHEPGCQADLRARRLTPTPAVTTAGPAISMQQCPFLQHLRLAGHRRAVSGKNPAHPSGTATITEPPCRARGGDRHAPAAA
jgi:hypothetical protein